MSVWLPRSSLVLWPDRFAHLIARFNLMSHLFDLCSQLNSRSLSPHHLLSDSTVLPPLQSVTPSPDHQLTDQMIFDLFQSLTLTVSPAWSVAHSRLVSHLISRSLSPCLLPDRWLTLTVSPASSVAHAHLVSCLIGRSLSSDRCHTNQSLALSLDHSFGHTPTWSVDWPSTWSASLRARTLNVGNQIEFVSTSTASIVHLSPSLMQQKLLFKMSLQSHFIFFFYVQVKTGHIQVFSAVFF
jgi:hypothetical protein